MLTDVVGAYECRTDGGRVGRHELLDQLTLDEAGVCVKRSQGEGFVGMLETSSFRGSWTYCAEDSTVKLVMLPDFKSWAELGKCRTEDTIHRRLEELPRDGSYKRPTLVNETLKVDVATGALLSENGRQYLKQAHFQLLQHPDNAFAYSYFQRDRHSLESTIFALRQQLDNIRHKSADNPDDKPRGAGSSLGSCPKDGAAPTRASPSPASGSSDIDKNSEGELAAASTRPDMHGSEARPHR